MRKVKESISRRFKPANLYVDDVLRIVEIFKEISSEVELVAEGYAFEDVSELKEIPKDYIHKLEITIKRPYISLGFDEDNLGMYVAEDTPENRGIIDMVSEYINSKGSFWFIVTRSRIVWVLLFILILIFLNCSTWLLGEEALITRISLFGISLIFTALLWIVDRNIDKRYNVIFLTNRREKASFLRRNKDRIILAAISILIGAIIYAAVNRLFQIF